MIEEEYIAKLDRLDRIPNDPAVPLDPTAVWSLQSELVLYNDSFAEQDDRTVAKDHYSDLKPK